MNTEAQLQSEALIRLLIAARYQDAKLSMPETNSLQQRMDDIPWDSGTGKSVFIMQETARVRDALSAPETRQKFMEAQCRLLTSPEAKVNALRILEAVLTSDGIDPKENRFLAHVSSILKV